MRRITAAVPGFCEHPCRNRIDVEYMPVRRRQLLVRLCLLAGLAATAARADEIAWSPDRLLTWADFAGPVARDTAPENVALTAASLGWSYEYVVESSSGECRFRVTNITALATFDRNRSWAKPEHRTAAVLAHEQGHFDITQIHKILFESLTRDHVGTTGPCGTSARRRSKLVTAAIEARVGPIYESVWQRHNAMQQAYDLETGHGTDAAAQAEWSRRIDAALRGDGLESLTTHETLADR